MCVRSHRRHHHSAERQSEDRWPHRTDTANRNRGRMWSAKKYNKNKLSGNKKIYNEIQIYVLAVCSR